jgi:amidohydrolase
MGRFLATMLASAALCALLPLQAHAELDVVGLKSTIERSLESDYPRLDALYKDIHAHREIAFQEEKTAAKLATEMRALGFEVTEHVGKTGLVAIYKNGDGPTIMVRTELDALPMEEKTGLPYASHDKTNWQGRETFVAHSCGHDIHMASWVGTAKTLVGLKDQWHGSLMFIAQPAEETVSGAKAMLADGLFTRFPKPNFGFALHDGPFAYGTVLDRVGIGSSNSDGLYIKFRGRGGHGAVPQATIDPVMMAAQAREGDGPQLPANHSPLFAPVPKPTIETGVEAMTLAVLSVFDQDARGK